MMLTIDEKLYNPLRLGWKLIWLWFLMRTGFDPSAPWGEKLKWELRIKKPHIFFYHLASPECDQILGVHAVYPDDNAVIFDLISQPKD